MRIRKAGLFLFLLCGYLVASAQEVIPIKDTLDEKIISVSDLDVFVDTTGTYTFDQVKKQPQLFTTHPNFAPRDYDVTDSYWIKLTLNVDSTSQKQWIIEFFDQTIDHIQAYVPTVGGGYQKVDMGDQYLFEKKVFRHKNFELQIPPDFKGAGQLTYYFKINSHTYADIRIALRSINRFVQYALMEYILYGFFYGMILIISLYNILMYFAIREIKYLYYTFYLISVGIFAMCVDGIAYQYLWPHMPNWNQIAHGVAMFSLIFWALVFGQQFLSTKTRAPRLHQFINWVIGLRTALFAYALIWNHGFFEWRNIEVLPLSLVFYASIYVLIKGFKPARFFVMAYGVLFLGFLLKALVNYDVIPFSILSYYSLHICFILEMLFLSFALSDRVRILKNNKDRAMRRIIIQHQENVELKDKVNQELEELVEKRTKELHEKNLLLEETNRKLYQQTSEIGKINSLLDLDNWKLKNNIKEILQERLLNKNLTLEEFNKIFPDTLSCYRFLEKLKWGDGFSCVKCGNEKYTAGKTKFSRRCTKCGYAESITSNTVFHKIKFPIEKAFYILYLTNDRQNQYTLDEMAEMLDMRRNTVWNFKKKIETVYQSAKKNGESFLAEDLFTAHLKD